MRFADGAKNLRLDHKKWGKLCLNKWVQFFNKFVQKKLSKYEEKYKKKHLLECLRDNFISQSHYIIKNPK